MRDNNSARNGKGTRLQGKSEANWAEEIETLGAALIAIRKLSLAMRAMANIKITGDWGIRLVA